MKFVQVNPSDLNLKSYKKTELHSFLEDFLKSEIEVAEIKDWEKRYVSINSCQGSVSNAIRNYNYNSVSCISRNNKIYLVNNSLRKENE